jgi:hypothetical protein
MKQSFGRIILIWSLLKIIFIKLKYRLKSGDLVYNLYTNNETKTVVIKLKPPGGHFEFPISAKFYPLIWMNLVFFMNKYCNGHLEFSILTKFFPIYQVMILYSRSKYQKNLSKCVICWARTRKPTGIDVVTADLNALKLHNYMQQQKINAPHQGYYCIQLFTDRP